MLKLIDKLIHKNYLKHFTVSGFHLEKWTKEGKIILGKKFRGGEGSAHDSTSTRLSYAVYSLC